MVQFDLKRGHMKKKIVYTKFLGILNMKNILQKNLICMKF